MTRHVLAGDPDGQGFAWIDLESPTPEELREVVERFGLAGDTPVGRRIMQPSLIDEGGYVVVTLAGADEHGEVAEVQCYADQHRLVSVHGPPIPGLSTAVRRAGSPEEALDVLANIVVTGLVASVRELDGQVEAIEDGSTADPGAVRQRLVAMRRIALSQRDVLTRLGHGEGLPDPAHPRTRNLRNSAERMGRIAAELETLREALHDAVADRQGDVVRRLTVLAAVFLPLTFVTGFFGQNFGWLVDHIEDGTAFALWGVGLPAAVVAVLLAVFRRRGWL